MLVRNHDERERRCAGNATIQTAQPSNTWTHCVQSCANTVGRFSMSRAKIDRSPTRSGYTIEGYQSY